MKEKLRAMNRSLLELRIGILACGLVMWCVVLVVSIIIRADILCQSLSLVVGLVMCLVSTWHMYRTLDVGLEYGSDAQKKIFAGYMVRYAAVALCFVLICLTNYLNPIVSFAGYMNLKFGAYLQPFTHKLTNRYFDETDPVPMSLEEIEALEAAQREAEEQNKENIDKSDTEVKIDR